jgi:hypothetical protein
MPTTPNSIITTQGINTQQVVTTAAKTTYNDLVNAVLAYTAGPNGAVVYGVTALPRANVTASQLQLYRSPDGTAAFFEKSVVMPVYNFSDITAPTQTDFGYSETVPLRLEPNERLYVANRVALAGGVSWSVAGEDL